jgi:hypothetical protein
MTGPRRLGWVFGLVLLLGLVVTPGVPPTTVSGAAAAASLPAWHGGVDLYRAGTFTTQKSWLWCTAAGVQIVRNIVKRTADHSASGQRRYFDWMRGRNRYDLPLSAGVDAAGWAAGMRHFVDARYRLVSSATFDDALRSAVKRMRLTNLPVALTVSHGNHGWILTGFRATADPAATSSFKVTSVRVVGPLYGLQSKNGYDMPPNTRLTPSQLRRFFTPWRYAPLRMIWDGRYVSIQPVPKTISTARSAATPRPIAATASSTVMPSVPASALATPAPTTSSGPLAVVVASAAPRGSIAVDVSATVGATGDVIPSAAILFLAAAVAGTLAAVAYAARRRAG